MENDQIVPTNARAATIDALLVILKTHLDPVPKRDTFRLLLKRAGIPKFKANPAARRGGGITHYSVAAVEKLIRSRTTGKGAE